VARRLNRLRGVGCRPASAVEEVSALGSISGVLIACLERTWRDFE
jgi:hypothetical protein